MKSRHRVLERAMHGRGSWWACLAAATLFAGCAPSAWVQADLCGELRNAYGPFDYRSDQAKRWVWSGLSTSRQWWSN